MTTDHRGFSFCFWRSLLLFACVLALAGCGRQKDRNEPSAQQPTNLPAVTAQAIPQPATTAQMASVLALRSRAGAKTGELVMAPGYYFAGDRGGGWFVWNADVTTPDDGGRFIAPSDASGKPGRWLRILNGETANVKMWGARGDDSTDDTAAIKNAIAACRNSFAWTKELLFPTGRYVISDTLVFHSTTHLRGEASGAVIIRMQGDKNVFMTENASNALAGAAMDLDHQMLVEDLTIRCTPMGTNNAGLVLCLPGEASTIRNINILDCGYGIRCFGVGSPGLRLLHATIHDCFVASVSIEGYMPTGKGLVWAGDDQGPVNIIGLSGDHRRADSDALACCLRVDKCCPTISCYDFKAEGQYGGGFISYNPGNLGLLDKMGSVSIYGGTYDCGANGGRPRVPCDLVVLKGDGQRTASVKIDPLNLYGVRYLIRDEVTGRTVEPDTEQGSGKDQTTCRLPVQYEGFVDPRAGVRSRLVVGETALSDLVPPAPGWYRVMTGLVGRMTGKLVISSLNESSELHFDVLRANDSAGAELNVARKSRDNGSTFRPSVTKARAGAYFDNARKGTMAFLDIYVERLISGSAPSDKRIVLAHPLEGLSRVWPSTGAVQLLAPTNALSDILPSGNCRLYQCVTNSLIR